MINFLLGQPSTDLLSTEIFSRAAQEAFAAPGAADRMLQYAHEKGNPLFLERLAKFLSAEYKDDVPVKNLCATPGASLAVQHILTMLTRPASTTRFAFFQNPTYHFEYKIFSDVGFTDNQFVGVPEDSDGLCTDSFEEILRARFPAGPEVSDDAFYSAVLYCVPTHANPSSTILSHARRAELVRLAREYNVLVICDDVYDMLTFDQDPLPRRLVAYDLDDLQHKQCGRPVVISNGSFSKILAPGSRAGWIEAHPELVDRLGLWYGLHCMPLLSIHTAF
ncbi:pyridoxal phosphate-dependent transferase [Syncephalastrum racemosum]|uniref:Pyridoxal phosphate-dependent transferase n=1 Tax=Syncephalastrum racemosum TaxID=13706 RepID=A0A1X2H4M1_SYNRA|nr:pyridoxal phosphate-dependent transferase [Syncephalastrum racemosum]